MSSRLRDCQPAKIVHMHCAPIRISLIALTVGAAACSSNPRQGSDVSWPMQLSFEFARLPDSVPQRWSGLLGEYGPDTTKRWYVLERDRRLWILDHQGNYVPLAERSDTVFDAPLATVPVTGEVRFSKDASGRGTSVRVGETVMARRNFEPAPGVTQLRITPRRPVEELRREALAATPPIESGSLKQPELVELRTLDSTIKLDIRYASDNNFLGAKVYDEGRAFLQRPAAEALVRAHKVLRQMGFGLLVHDAYRPWYVTKIFWDATPDSVRWLVADPAQGSKHNRGAAVDVTLYDRETGKAVEMPSTYDETTHRARSDYPGGTSLQRWHRALLIRALQHEGFVVNPLEWWHFDHKDWKSYPIINVPFDRIAIAFPAR
jgi:D-alanyl-D-alanine dipeptidase